MLIAQEFKRLPAAVRTPVSGLSDDCIRIEVKGTTSIRLALCLAVRPSKDKVVSRIHRTIAIRITEEAEELVDTVGVQRQP